MGVLGSAGLKVIHNDQAVGHRASGMSSASQCPYIHSWKDLNVPDSLLVHKEHWKIINDTVPSYRENTNRFQRIKQGQY